MSNWNEHPEVTSQKLQSHTFAWAHFVLLRATAVLVQSGFNPSRLMANCQLWAYIWQSKKRLLNALHTPSSQPLFQNIYNLYCFIPTQKCLRFRNCHDCPLFVIYICVLTPQKQKTLHYFCWTALIIILSYHASSASSGLCTSQGCMQKWHAVENTKLCFPFWITSRKSWLQIRLPFPHNLRRQPVQQHSASLTLALEGNTGPVHGICREMSSASKKNTLQYVSRR